MPPIITTNVETTRQMVAAARVQGKTIGMVPTMGALHAGHASLIRAARADTDFVAVSIFVNPTQFGPKEDLSRYPRPFAKDVEMCASEGVDLIFHPAPEVMYRSPFHTYVEVHEMQDVLCGKSRPGHFRGVATVVLKLLNIVQPDRAYFGLKDAQQGRIIMQMVRDLNVPIEIKLCPIVREPDGLAMSSRNAYLNPEDRLRATILHGALTEMQKSINRGHLQADKLIQIGESMINAIPGVRLDYLSIVEFEELKPLEHLQGVVLIAGAIFIGTTRLIDNVIVEVGENYRHGSDVRFDIFDSDGNRLGI